MEKATITKLIKKPIILVPKTRINKIIVPHRSMKGANLEKNLGKKCSII